MIFLHCGLRKTGSTAIQVAAGRGRFSGVRHSKRSRTELALDEPSERWLKRVVRHSSSGTVLLSCENVFRRRNFLAVEPPARRAAYLLDRLGRDDTTLVIYVRPHLPWLESMYFQHLQNRGTATPPQFLEQFLGAGAADISGKIREISGEVRPGRLVVRIHHQSTDAVADLARVMEVDLADGPGPRVNTSLADDDLWALAELNRIDPRLCWYALDKIRRHPENFGSGERTSVFSASEQQQLASSLAADWMALAPYVSVEGTTSDAALRTAWEESLAGRPFTTSAPDDRAEARARALHRYLSGVPGWVDSRIVERVRNWDRLVESFRWRLKIGF